MKRRMSLNPGTDLRRRATLKTLLAACAWGALPASASAANTAGATDATVFGAATLHKRPIPSSNEMIPVVGLGTSGSFETDPDQDLAPLREVLKTFVDRGGRLVDTAPSYGNAEAVVGRLAEELGIRDQLFMASKVDRRGEQDGIARMEGSQQRLGGQPLDLFQVHNLIDVERQLETLRRWKEEGRVRYIGITHYRVDAFDELERLMRAEDLDFVQFNYSVVTPDAERRLLPLAQERGQAVLINRAYEDGDWFQQVRGKPLPDWAAEFDCTSWGQFALKYVLANPAVTCVIPATSKVKHLIDNLGAGTGRLPDGAMQKRMRELVSSL
ncbi:MAG: aldo/keto reductase [Thiohalobacteraceae bacterium]